MAKPKQATKTMARYGGAHKRREIMKQAASDLERGLANTDCRVSDQTSESECPRPSPRKKR
jgi:hypothetical protein